MSKIHIFYYKHLNKGFSVFLKFNAVSARILDYPNMKKVSVKKIYELYRVLRKIY